MKNRYIVSNAFYIKDNLNSFLLYFDYFITPGLSVKGYMKNKFLNRIVYNMLRTIIVLLYISHAYTLRYKRVSLTDNALIIFKGSGKWGNLIKLVEDNGKLKIIKKVFNKNIFFKEKKFYEKYKSNRSRIKLPICYFREGKIIEQEFLPFKSFRRSIIDGSFDIKKSLKHFQKLKKELSVFYGDKPTLIHGDLWLTNIFINKDIYYLIDFSECFMNSPKFDLYVLLHSILASHQHINGDHEKIEHFQWEGEAVTKLLETNKEHVKKLEKQFIRYRRRRFS